MKVPKGVKRSQRIVKSGTQHGNYPFQVQNYKSHLLKDFSLKVCNQTGSNISN